MIPRRAEASLRRALRTARVAVVNGPRQAGKSTLLKLVADELDRPLVSLDDLGNLRLARTDPQGFVTDSGFPLFIDEIQRGGERLVLSIKAEVDRRHLDNGLFVLAGSSRFLTVPTISESLAGRVRLIDLWPLSQAEIEATQPAFLDAAFAGVGEFRRLDIAPSHRADVFRRVAEGGFPAVRRLPDQRDRADWFEDYLRTLVLRDLTELSRIRQADDLPTLVRLIGARTAQELNVADLGRDAGLNVDTLRHYLGLLETIYLFVRLRSWSTNITSRSVRRPKLHVVDSGLAAHLIGTNAAQLAMPTSTVAGALLESFVVGELTRLLPTSSVRAEMFHHRTHDGAEIDLVIEAADGRVVAIEVKSAVTVDDDDIRHLAGLRDTLGDRFVNGIVLHLGERPMALGERLTAVPITALWSG